MPRKVKLLCFTDLTTHPPFDTTVELYNRLALDDRFDAFHSPVSVAASASKIAARSLDVELTYKQFLQLDQQPICIDDIEAFDLAFCRADKPYPVGYLDYLTSLEGRVGFVNRPSSIARLQTKEQQYDLYGDLLRDSVFTGSLDEALRFVSKHPITVLKRSGSYGGRGVYKLSRSDASVLVEHVSEDPQQHSSPESALKPFFEDASAKVELVPFRKNIGVGDKRVLVVDGEILGGYLRVSSSGGWVHNITAGGEARASDVSAAEVEVVTASASRYKSLGVHTLGYDFLMDDHQEWVLSEINAGNIGGYGRLEELSGSPIYPRLLDWLYRFVSG